MHIYYHDKYMMNGYIYIWAYLKVPLGYHWPYIITDSHGSIIWVMINDKVYGLWIVSGHQIQMDSG
jgi:hypothetical protein